MTKQTVHSYRVYDTTECAILMPLNKDVNSLNQKILQIFPGVSRTYFSADFIEPTDAQGEEDAEVYPSEFLNRLEPKGMSVHSLELKEGAPVAEVIQSFGGDEISIKFFAIASGLHHVHKKLEQSWRHFEWHAWQGEEVVESQHRGGTTFGPLPRLGDLRPTDQFAGEQRV